MARISTKRALPKPAKTARPEDARLAQGLDTRELLLETAAGLLLKGSVSGMAISEVVKLSGVPASSIYWHFGSKEGLVSAVAAAAVDRWLASLPDTATLPPTGEERLVAGATLLSEALARDNKVVLLMMKVGLELADGDHPGIDIIRRARADVIDYGTRLIAPLFADLPGRQAEAAAADMTRRLMVFADGIAVATAIGGRNAISRNEYRALPGFARMLYADARARLKAK